ncbi:hypothetical protein DPMN_010379 [Dreissena polymorpha]|uniref:Uncharacterized protein n=1 Tax=Dreissena polymorpha TaxID=45954 RepID=A0A9D4N343_DREPO|nr:hypothetical protein DPMN_010379 [Dreissena polymorpha]
MFHPDGSNIYEVEIAFEAAVFTYPDRRQSPSRRQYLPIPTDASALRGGSIIPTDASALRGGSIYLSRPTQVIFIL